MNYIKVVQAAKKWGLTPRRVRVLCSENKIKGVKKDGNIYLIPENSPRPVDGRILRCKIIDSAFVPEFHHLESLKKELDSKRPLTAGEIERLRNDFLINFTYNSNAIEGNTLTIKETAMVLEGLTIDKKPLKDHLEAVGHRDAFLFIEDLAKKGVPINEKTIKDIHSLVLMNKPEDKGVFRRIPVTIMGAYTNPVQPYMIEPKITELILNNEQRIKSMYIVERIARFHLEFEGIHPFIDGNGRTGRLILNLDLIQNGFPPINIKFSDRKRYYEAFDSFYRDEDASVMINLISEYLEERLNEYLNIL
ncbi:cell division protein Fic [Vallitalea longa]|uniref:Cell division protein Fic n=1 Tax=Vallitalea longa TaxID=2936439 RepID=A0A9W5Y9J6_9FIRM|nr:Fic family protein [Vallitalea longa]GKX28298.1 cell division protein Fic [Vallitalea longa]